MVDITSLGPLGTLISPIQGIIKTLEVILGGIFGLYLVFIIIRYYFMRKEKKLLTDIKQELKNIGNRLDDMELRSSKKGKKDKIKIKKRGK